MALAAGVTVCFAAGKEKKNDSDQGLEFRLAFDKTALAIDR